MTLLRNGVPSLRPGVLYTFDPVRGQEALLYPEGVLLLNDSAGAIARRIDGIASVDDLSADLASSFDGVDATQVSELLDSLLARQLLTFDAVGPTRTIAPQVQWQPAMAPPGRPPVPLGLIAELTYRCPLHCFYCSNPVNLASYRDELSTAEWIQVLDQARALGVLQLHLTGGEPLLRRDLATLISHARSLGMYVNLVSSGLPATPERLAGLVAAGLTHFQLSVQDADVASANRIAGVPAAERKRAVAAAICKLGIPLTVNVVLHSHNVTRVADIADLAAEMGAARLELAHTQYYGWALRNRNALMPRRDQVEHAAAAAEAAGAKYRDRMQVVHVRADYHGRTPKPCMNGWGMRQFAVAPNGLALPCLAAAQLPDVEVPDVRTSRLSDIWYGAELFTRFRGTDWMPEPCRSCALKEIDFGGCRCQAYQLTGDATATDPACELSPFHERVVHYATGAETTHPVHRVMPRRT